MTTMTRFVPFRSAFTDVAVLQNRLNSIFSDFARPAAETQEGLAEGNFVPPVDVYEDEHKLVLKLEIAGVKQNDLDVKLENQTLTIKGERKFEAEENLDNYHRIERRFGSFSRSFTLPMTVDTGAVAAKYEDGVLTIQLGKKEAAKPRQVKIEIGAGAGPANPGEPRQVEGSTK